MNIEPAPPGSWRSPITLDAVFADGLGLSGVSIRGHDIYWLESRVAEGGRSVLVRRDGAGDIRDISAAPMSLRNRTHEYGGGAYALGGSSVYFCNDDDQALYALSLATRQNDLLADTAGMRYADLIVDARRRRLIAVREDHSVDGREALNTVVAIALDEPHAQTVLQQGADFYSSICLSPDGQQLTWLSWMHPNMPWDGTTLWIAGIDSDGALRDPLCVAGGDAESIFQPRFSPRGELVFASDRSGWWNLYRWRDRQIQALHPMEAEFGMPQWVFGLSLYGFDRAGRIVCAFRRRGDSQLATLDCDSGELTEIVTPYRDIGELQVGDGFVVFVGGSPTQAPVLVKLDLASGRIEVLRRASPLQIIEDYVSVPQAIEFPTTGGNTAHAYFYPPRNRDYELPPGVKPPLRVINHGGPTSATTATFNAAVQYWTSRGFAIVDVNYGGSSGYGRAYRQRLNGQWGVVDVDDAVNAARYLVERGLVDGDKLCIKGGSAGGYTTLAALTFRDTFKAGASYYGIGDLETLARDTHKFESRYMDSLVGPYPAMQSLYRERSPIHHTERLSTPLILFQGLKDMVVPPNQSQAMFDAVRAKGVPVAYVSFPNERHGFRALEANQRALSAEFYFYGRVFGFVPADEIEPVAIENL
ncbi:MAG: peptidase prolyl oligopeptidase active site region [Hydrocarboniphaga sp.]|uniref:S9 family peptidase n=1 Tax=Hydrocarboniphaga sp. TaxID=2033016 RepID=UPI002615D46F|nr:S9 family peptidase [Hydrocarboniphaga sp.]MDB5968536.1 peptidase prolyl oligopeptidase active site region [Hydrocarboniphaga sp.]